MNWWIICMQKYADFDGRARRTEYWMFSLFSFIFALVAVFLDNVLGTAMEETGYGIIYLLFALAIAIPTWAVLVRRLHDIGKSGWWIFITLVPVIGGIWLFILTLTDSEPGSNEYGENPKLLNP
jgi:uncharacterized membrane protein YhaH (DUF805 family)